MGEVLNFVLPLVNEQGQSKGYMYLPRQKRPRDLPRLGETIVIIGGSKGLNCKIKDIVHSNFFNSVTLHFESEPYTRKKDLEEHDKNWTHYE